MEYIELIFKENCKLSQGDKSQYFFLKASNVNKNDKLNLPRQFNQNYYEAILVFQGEWNINVPFHVWDI